MPTGLLKMCAWLAPVFGSLVVWVGILPPLLPVAVVVTIVLLTGAFEGPAARVLIRARALNELEREMFAPILARLSELGLVGIEVRLADQASFTMAFGRRTVVLADDVAARVVQGRADNDVVVTLLAHAAVGTRAGLTRRDAALEAWCLPWRVMAWLGSPPTSGLAAFVWKMRFVVLIVAVVQSLEHPVLTPGVATIAILSYLHPWAKPRWFERIDDVQDAETVALGLGRQKADTLRTIADPPQRILQRIRRLDPPEVRPHLRLVS